MKNKILTIVLLSSFINGEIVAQPKSIIDPYNRKENRKAIRKYESMTPDFLRAEYIFIDSGTFVSNRIGFNIARPANDTNTITGIFPIQKVKIQSFFLQKKEVTNRQYKEFTDWVIDSIALTMLAKNDPSYYREIGSMSIDWEKRKKVRDTSNLKLLYPLYLGIKTKNGIEYRINPEFVTYEFRKINEISGKCLIYPDTMCWLTKTTFAYNDPLVKHYFSHKSFSAYPVVGVSRQQALAYCDWLGRTGKAEYRLPTSSEFEFAYIPPIKKHISSNKSGKRGEELISNPTIFPWRGYEVLDQNVKYYANFGMIIDSYGFIVKDYAGDGHLFTARTGLFPTSVNGLYDLAGNVAEWASDDIDTVFRLKDIIYPTYRSYMRGGRYPTSSIKEEKSEEHNRLKHEELQNTMSVSVSESFESIASKLFDYHYNDPKLKQYWEGKMTLTNLKRRPENIVGYQDAEELYLNESGWEILTEAKYIFEDFEIIRKNPGAGIICGGSWQDNPALLSIGVKRIFPKTTGHPTIGFRTIAMPN